MKKCRIVLKREIGSLFIVAMMIGCGPSPEQVTPEPATAIDESKPAIHAVEITQMKFYPAELKVKKGDKVVFVNHDLVTHDITEESKKEWNSSPLVTDQTWILVVTESVNYFCSIHPVMKGRIIVE